MERLPVRQILHPRTEHRSEKAAILSGTPTCHLASVACYFTVVAIAATLDSMIKSFRHKGLRELFLIGRSAKVAIALQERCLRRLDALQQAVVPKDMNVPGFDFHALRGKPKRYSVHVNGPWCITFEFEEGHAWRVDLEQYH